MKYNNTRTEVDNIKFDSKKEANRYGILKLLEKAGKIGDLQLQVPFTLEVNGHKICKYRADFCYIEDYKYIVEDCKGFKTPEYKLKYKLMKAIHGIEIKES